MRHDHGIKRSKAQNEMQKKMEGLKAFYSTSKRAVLLERVM